MSEADAAGSEDDTVIGVALAIPQPHAETLTAWRRRVDDPAAELVFPHVTLLPPTAVAADAMATVETHLADAARVVEPFSMHLAGTGTFRPVSPVVFIQVATGVSQCELLERAIRRGPLMRELDYPYHPHVTIAHALPDEQLDEAYEGLAGFIARFPVGALVLFTRSSDGTWKWEREFPLGVAA